MVSFENAVNLLCRFLCGIVKELVDKLANTKISEESGDDSIACKCMVLNEKLSALLNTLDKEAASTPDLMASVELTLKSFAMHLELFFKPSNDIVTNLILYGLEPR